jgi:hypothetical protein
LLTRRSRGAFYASLLFLQHFTSPAAAAQAVEWADWMAESEGCRTQSGTAARRSGRIFTNLLHNLMKRKWWALRTFYKARFLWHDFQAQRSKEV